MVSAVGLGYPQTLSDNYDGEKTGLTAPTDLEQGDQFDCPGAAVSLFVLDQRPYSALSSTTPGSTRCSLHLGAGICTRVDKDDRRVRAATEQMGMRCRENREVGK